MYNNTSQSAPYEARTYSREAKTAIKNIQIGRILKMHMEKQMQIKSITYSRRGLIDGGGGGGRTCAHHSMA